MVGKYGIHRAGFKFGTDYPLFAGGWDNFIFSSGVLENEDGTRSQKFYYGKQDISDEIMIEPYDLELDYRYEGIVVVNDH
ncbi:MAG: hypothetical protein NC347_07455 [Clostridium sp.]|nr:hypothetical protein [Clostridium sp.]